MTTLKLTFEDRDGQDHKLHFMIYNSDLAGRWIDITKRNKEHGEKIITSRFTNTVYKDIDRVRNRLTDCLNRINAIYDEPLPLYPEIKELSTDELNYLHEEFERYGDRMDELIAGETNWSRVRDDCIISSTMAMCQAEELGVQTGFCGSIGGIDIANRLGKQDKVAEIVVGFGYANADPYFQRRVYKDGVVVGFDLSNTDPTKRTAENRKNRPAKDTMINYL
jgi:hypothetical protein